MPPTTIHERIIAAVGERSIRHIAEITGSHHESVRRYLRGQPPSAEFVTALCSALSLNADWLLTGRGPMQKSDLRAHAVANADPAALLLALGETIERLTERVERLELYLHTLETRLRVRAIGLPARSAQSGPQHEPPRNETPQIEARDADEKAPRSAPARVQRLRVPDPARRSQDDRRTPPTRGA